MVLTRVKYARVEIEGKLHSEIGQGFLILLGVGRDDTARDAELCADKAAGLRIFEDETGKMNLSPESAGAQMLVVSQFTLYADVTKRRPGFTDAARPEKAVLLYEEFVRLLRARGFPVETGVFGADMQVVSQNDGPVTIVWESAGCYCSADPNREQ